MPRPLNSKSTKVVATLGPASRDPEIIRQMIHAGMDVARINFSHGDHKTHGETIDTVRRIADEEKVNIAILCDIQGPKIRIGKVANEPLMVSPGDKITFTLDDVPGENGLISLPHPEFMKDVSVDTTLLLDDGNLQFDVVETMPRSVVCRVRIGGPLTSRKGVSAPNANLTLSAITEKDRADIEFALSKEADYIAMSFVRKADDIRQLRWLMNFFNGDAGIIAKIEMREALENIEEIIKICDGIMVARGDLGVETPAERVPVEQKRIITLCNNAAKPVITATQMLESMKSNPRPTRAEASDVYNAILDGTDAIMLSAESAAGKYPVRSVEVMNTIAITAEEEMWKSREASAVFDISDLAEESQSENISNAIGEATYHISAALNPKAIITTTLSGYTARRVARERPRTPILCMTPEAKTYRRMALVWGVHAFYVDEFNTIDEMLTVTVRAAHDAKHVRRGDLLVIIAGVPFGIAGQTNLLKVHRVGEQGEI
ncbi:pyruvate kinase [Phototrophicus methaneseepsis]|uniref:Pyruvate kinase n=1 Tax=Phototrophicus methaneseepsis TaxID=2710758 RepID=A0A7S8ID29_9CHLR|nr:pyruvate kinase [Phototrophicus methaneseepsis]QPC81121.1 pyruvate kinase [Phototrophicus methaneseepsis]